VLLSEKLDRNGILEEFKRNNIVAVFHYVPLHSSPAGKEFGKTFGGLSVTDALSEQLIRLPMWLGISEQQQEKVIQVLENAILSNA
jgi:dTDP-4-amino-4,6-dideoxygalactose transaminase